MMRNPDVKHLALAAAALPLAGLLAVGCAGRRPVAELARADQAIRHAQTTSAAASSAPAELATAQVKLGDARRAMANGDYTDARDLADQARVYAELAEEKAEAQDTVTATRRTVSEVQVLPGEAGSAEPVVVEQRTVTRTAPSSVVIEHPATTVIERTSAPPVDVVVERPQAPTGTVVQHDPPVIVVPE